MDIRHFYTECGDGPALILLHGNGEDHTCFRNQTDALAKHFHVFAPDTRGHGNTPRGEAPFTISQFADDLKDFMAEAGIPKASLLGFSDGGNIAMVFAIRYPEKVDKLILNGANLNPKGVRASLRIRFAAEYLLAKRASRRDENAKKKAELLGLMVNDPNVAPEELRKIKSPTLVLAGTRDLILKKETEQIARSIRDSSLVFLEGDHFLLSGNPAEYNETVLSFLLKN